MKRTTIRVTVSARPSSKSVVIKTKTSAHSNKMPALLFCQFPDKKIAKARDRKTSLAHASVISA